MAVRVDQAGQQRPPVCIDPLRDLWPRVTLGEQSNDAPILADDQPSEALQPTLRIDLDAIGIVDQHVGQSGGGNGGEEQRRGCDHGGAHHAGIALFGAP